MQPFVYISGGAWSCGVRCIVVALWCQFQWRRFLREYYKVNFIDCSMFLDVTLRNIFESLFRSGNVLPPYLNRLFYCWVSLKYGGEHACKGMRNSTVHCDLWASNFGRNYQQLHEFEWIVLDSSDFPIDPQRSPRFCVENHHVLSSIFT